MLTSLAIDLTGKTDTQKHLHALLGIMFYYSLFLTGVALGMLSVIVILSLIVAPMFRDRLNEQFLLGARNQAFTTEYVAGLETVKRVGRG